MCDGKIKVEFLSARECGDVLTLTAKLNLQDKLNRSTVSALREVDNLHRVISVNYSDSPGIVKRNCALVTVWYEVCKPKNKDNKDKD